MLPVTARVHSAAAPGSRARATPTVPHTVGPEPPVQWSDYQKYNYHKIKYRNFTAFSEIMFMNFKAYNQFSAEP